MQVAHQNDHITHAVIGGSQTIDFGISSSAEFFNILSSTLYKDQILAVVREVLCNAWDAHIEAGCTHLPVEITLTEDKFTIKDLGKGIHRDDMGLIYGTYGNSTKKNDGMQTGGFGLGCKAPFAYTDHFEVISCNDGVKTIYSLSKSSAQAMGKPGIVPIASFPTEDTGLQVSIGIANRSDWQRFKSLIKRIVKNGDMNMTLNSELLPKLGFDTMKANYLITLDTGVLDSMPEIMVRYGNVIYPVDSVEKLSDQYASIRGHLNKLGTRYLAYRIVFQAPPHSISVTPSRESLSMQDHTIKSLTTLFTGFLDMVNGGFETKCDTYAEASVQEAVKAAKVSSLLSRKLALPTAVEHETPVRINDLETMAKRYMESNYPASIEFRKKDIVCRLKLMAAGGLLDRGIVQSYLRVVDDVKTGLQYRNNWLQQRIIGPLSTKLVKAGLDHTKLFGLDSEDRNVMDNWSGKRYTPLVAAASVSPTHPFAVLPYLRNIIVISTSSLNITDRAYKHKVFQERGQYHGFLFYHVSLKKAEREAVLAFFATSGMEVVDLTVRQEWEVVPNRPAVPVPRKPTKKGLVALSSIKSGRAINTVLSREDDAERIDNPEAVIQLSIRQGESKDMLDRWDRLSSIYVVDLFGDKVGVTNNVLMHSKALGNGAKEFRAYITEAIGNEMLTNPRIQEFWAFNPSRVTETHNRHEDLIDLIYATPSLRDHFKLVNNLTDNDKKFIHLWEKYDNDYHYYFSAADKKVKAHLNLIPLHKANETLIAKFTDNPMLEAISEKGLARILKGEADSPQVKKAIQLLLTVLNK